MNDHEAELRFVGNLLRFVTNFESEYMYDDDSNGYMERNEVDLQNQNVFDIQQDVQLVDYESSIAWNLIMLDVKIWSPTDQTTMTRSPRGINRF